MASCASTYSHIPHCCLQVSKAEKAMLKKQKAKEFTSAKSNTKAQKNAKRWN